MREWNWKGGEGGRGDGLTRNVDKERNEESGLELN